MNRSHYIFYTHSFNLICRLPTLNWSWWSPELMSLTLCWKVSHFCNLNILTGDNLLDYCNGIKWKTVMGKGLRGLTWWPLVRQVLYPSRRSPFISLLLTRPAAVGGCHIFAITRYSANWQKFNDAFKLSSYQILAFRWSFRKLYTEKRVYIYIYVAIYELLNKLAAALSELKTCFRI